MSNPSGAGTAGSAAGGAAPPPPVIPTSWLAPHEQRWLFVSLFGLIEVCLVLLCILPSSWLVTEHQSLGHPCSILHLVPRAYLVLGFAGARTMDDSRLDFVRGHCLRCRLITSDTDAFAVAAPAATVDRIDPRMESRVLVCRRGELYLAVVTPAHHYSREPSL